MKSGNSHRNPQPQCAASFLKHPSQPIAGVSQGLRAGHNGYSAVVRGSSASGTTNGDIPPRGAHDRLRGDLLEACIRIEVQRDGGDGRARHPSPTAQEVRHRGAGNPSLIRKPADRRAVPDRSDPTHQQVLLTSKGQVLVVALIRHLPTHLDPLPELDGVRGVVAWPWSYPLGTHAFTSARVTHQCIGVTQVHGERASLGLDRWRSLTGHLNLESSKTFGDNESGVEMSNRKQTRKNDSASASAPDQEQAAADHEQPDNFASNSDATDSGEAATVEQPVAPAADAHASTTEEQVDPEGSPVDDGETAPGGTDHKNADKAADPVASSDDEDTNDDSDEWEEHVETTYEQTAAGHRVTRRVTRRKSSRKTTREQAEETTNELTSETGPGWTDAPPPAYQAPPLTTHPAPVG